MQRQQQQQADYDLLAVFSDETKAEAAETKLHKEGFGSDEVFRLAADVVQGGQFREHGPNRDHSAVFLQTSRSGPNPATVVLLAIIFGVVLGLLTFAAHFAFSAIPELIGTIVGVVIGIIIGAVIGLLRRGPVRGNIGQDVARTSSRRDGEETVTGRENRCCAPFSRCRKHYAQITGTCYSAQ